MRLLRWARHVCVLPDGMFREGKHVQESFVSMCVHKCPPSTFFFLLLFYLSGHAKSSRQAGKACNMQGTNAWRFAGQLAGHVFFLDSCCWVQEEKLESFCIDSKKVVLLFLLCTVC